MAPSTIYLGLGSNLGDRNALLDQALTLLSVHGVKVLARSPVYETDPVADEPQPPYLNMAVRAETALPPPALLDVCLGIERTLGRVRQADRPRTSRTMDIDILLYGDAVISPASPRLLTIPHPALLQRPFVRIPLATVATPGLTHPVTRTALDVATPSASVRRMPPSTTSSE